MIKTTAGGVKFKESNCAYRRPRLGSEQRIEKALGSVLSKCLLLVLYFASERWHNDQTILPGIVYKHAWTGQMLSVSQTTGFTAVG